jgi:hypothetical protein
VTSLGSSEDPSPSSTPMEGVEQSSSLLDRKVLPQAKADTTLRVTPHTPAIGPLGVEPTNQASLRD